MSSNPGVYALMVGSGVSRGAGILTGWEIVLDLVRKLATMRGESGDPLTWYRDTFHKDPDYSSLLKALCQTPSERRNLLRSYFEPTLEEKDQGIKVPGPAHKAVADLVSVGLTKVIITTNFDRLIENALEDRGIVPQVISNDSSVRGSLPLIHADCTVVKVNGDYIDTRIRNTRRELSRCSATRKRSRSCCSPHSRVRKTCRAWVIGGVSRTRVKTREPWSVLKMAGWPKVVVGEAARHRGC